MVTVFHFEDGNDLITYQMGSADRTHQFEWSQPDDDEPFVYLGPGGEPPIPTLQEQEEAHERWRSDRVPPEWPPY